MARIRDYIEVADILRIKNFRLLTLMSGITEKTVYLIIALTYGKGLYDSIILNVMIVFA